MLLDDSQVLCERGTVVGVGSLWKGICLMWVGIPLVW